MAELGLYALTSLFGAGFLLSQSKQARPQKEGAGLAYNDKTVGTDIYNSHDYFKVKQEEFNRASNNWNDAKNPKVTGVIPMYYNTLQVKDDYEKIPNRDYNKELIYGVLNYLDNETQAKIRASSVHDRERAPTAEWGIVMDRPVPSASQEGADLLKQIGGSLLPDQQDFTHNNMVPFYRSNITQDTRGQSQGKDAKLELYTGQFKLNKPQKEEVPIMFKPMPENIYGTQIYRDLSRYNPNNTGKKHGETPIEKINVGPGLGQGYTNVPSGGRHETLRIMPKPIEQLRVDPVLETEAKTTSGASTIAKRTLVSQMYRNRPELLVTNHKGERNFTTTGANVAQMSQPTVVLRDTQRKKSGTIRGAAKSTVDGQRVTPKSKKSNKFNFMGTPFRNAAAQERMVSDYGRNGYVAYDNNRMHVQKAGGATGGGASDPSTWVFGGTSTIMNLLGLAGNTAHTVKVQDTVRKTRKQHYVHNVRSHTGNGNGAQQPSKGPAYDPLAWIAKKTIRETTEDNKHVGIAAAPIKKRIVWEGQQARKTVKETTEDNKRTGCANAANKRVKSYDDAYNARTNINKEEVAKGRAPTDRGPNLGYQQINVESKKLDDDRMNQYRAVKTSTIGNVFNPDAISKCTVTSDKNHLPQHDIRMDVGILDAFKRNPLTQSLSSWF